MTQIWIITFLLLLFCAECFRHILFSADENQSWRLTSGCHLPTVLRGKLQRQRDVRINKWFLLFEDVRQRRLSCAPAEAHTHVDNIHLMSHLITEICFLCRGSWVCCSFITKLRLETLWRAASMFFTLVLKSWFGKIHVKQQHIRWTWCRFNVGLHMTQLWGFEKPWLWALRMNSSLQRSVLLALSQHVLSFQNHRTTESDVSKQTLESVCEYFPPSKPQFSGPVNLRAACSPADSSLIPSTSFVTQMIYSRDFPNTSSSGNKQRNKEMGWGHVRLF